MSGKTVVVDVKFKDLRAAVVALDESKLNKDKDGKFVKLKMVGLSKDKILENFMKAVDAIPDDPETRKFPGPPAIISFYNAVIEAEKKAKEEAGGEAEKATAVAKTKVDNKKPDKAPEKKEPVKKATGKVKEEKKEGGRSETDSRGRRLFKEGTNAGKIQKAVLEAPASGLTYEQIAKSAKIESTNEMSIIKKTVGDLVVRGIAKKDDKGKIVYIP